MTPFTPDGAVSDLVIGHASAVLPDVVIEDARLIVRRFDQPSTVMCALPGAS